MKLLLMLALLLSLGFAPGARPPALADGTAWQAVAGPLGASVPAMVMSPNYANDHSAFAGLRGHGVYRTIDGGNTWQPAGLPDQVIVDLAISPNYANDQTLFAAVGLGAGAYNIYRSTDGGTNWQPPYVSPYSYGFKPITRLSISPDYANDHTLYALNGAETYQSIDGGQTFFKSGGWFATHTITHLVFSPAVAIDHTLFAAVQNDGVYKSTDGGAHWNSAALSGDILALAVSPNYPNDHRLAASTVYNGSLYLSSDGGTSWNLSSVSLGVSGPHTLLYSPTFASDHLMFAVGTNASAYRSTDAGLNWTQMAWPDIGMSGFADRTFFTLAVSPDTSTDAVALAGSSSGIYRSLNRGENWYLHNTGLPRLTVRSVAIAPDDSQYLLAGTSYFENQRADSSPLSELDGNLQLSTDGGQSWQQVSGPLDRIQRVVFSPNFVNDHITLAITDMAAQHGAFTGGIYRSTNGGRVWDLVLMGPAYAALAVSPNFGDDHTAWVYASAGARGTGIFRSVDSGATWALWSGDIQADTIVPSANYAVDLTLFASTPDHHLQKSIDAGKHWTPVLNGTVTALALSPAYGASQTLYAGVKESSSVPGAIQRSTDGGATWQQSISGIPAVWDGKDLNISTLNFAADGSVLAGVTYGDGTSGAAVYRSVDGGQTWQPIASGLTDDSLFDLTSASLDPEGDRRGALAIYAGTSSGLWRSDQPQGDSIEHGTWDSGGPRGGRADVLVLSPDFAQDGVAFTGESNWFHFNTQYGRGIFKSSDWGQTWRASNNGTQSGSDPSSAVNGFAFSPNFASDHTVFFASWGGLFKSTDGGENWQLLARGMYASIAVAPNYPASGHMMARGVYGCLYRTTDFGVHWSTDCSAQFPTIAYSSNFAADHSIFIAEGGVRQSNDGGLSWTPILTAPVSGVVVSPQYDADHTLFANGNALYRSTDGGTTWISVTIGTGNSPIGTPALSPAFAADHTLFVVDGNGVYRSSDGGLHWDLIPSTANLPLGTLAISPGWPAHPYLLMGTAQGVYRSTDGGTSWARMPGLTTLATSAIALSSDETLWLTGTTNGIHASTDAGHTWFPFGLQESRSDISNIAMSPAFSSDHTIFAVAPCPDCIGASVSRTTDGGATWNRVYEGTQAIGPLAISPQYSTDHTIYAGTYDFRIVGSSDGGDHWAPIGAWPAGTTSAVRLVALPPNYPADHTIFAANPGFWRLPPGGTTWQRAASGIPSIINVVALAVSPNYAQSHTLLAATVSYVFDSVFSEVFRSDDSGVNWQTSDIGLPNTELRSLAFSPNYAADQTVYVVSASQVYRSIDGGYHWTAIGAPPGGPELNQVSVTRAGQVIVTSSAGVWRYSTRYRDILIDGDFEAGSGWEFISGASRTENVVFTGRHTLRLGIDNGGNAALDSAAVQTVTIPISATLAQLNLRVYPVTSETQAATHSPAMLPNAAVGDAQYATLTLSGTTSISRTLFWTLSNAQAWQRYSFDLSPYAGQTIVLRMGVFNDGQGGQTAMYVDDVGLIIGPGGTRVYLPLILKSDAH